MQRTKRLRIFAGPNGSGKSSIYQLIATQYNVGTYINADELQLELVKPEGVLLSRFHSLLNGEDFSDFYGKHALHLSVGANFPFVISANGHLKLLEAGNDPLKLSYAVAVLADYLRTGLIEASKNLSFETVLSHPSKLSFIRQAKAKGYRIYLYYVCVASPEISKQRVALRVKQGGHYVPNEKIENRYERSLALLKDAVVLSDRAYLFDNTYSKASLKLEINHASEVIAHEPQLPEWITRSLPTLVAAK